jgi:hypothetical protein
MTSTPSLQTIFSPIITHQHLVFRTSCTSRFQFGKGIRRPTSIENSQVPSMYSLVEEGSANEAGNILLDGPGPKKVDKAIHEFIVISEAEYFGFGEEKFQLYDNANAGYLLYNIMLVSRDNSNGIASRLGYGRVYKTSWEKANPRSKVVILG